MKRILGFGLAAALFLTGSLAVAQIVTLPTVTSVGSADLFQDIVGGVPTQTNKYATAAQIAGVPGYHNFGTITTDPAYAVPNGTTDLMAHAAGTISTVTITTEPNPGDGKRECWFLDQTTSTLTWTANTGQTIGANVHGAGAANVPNCITYVASSATWVSGP